MASGEDRSRDLYNSVLRKFEENADAPSGVKTAYLELLVEEYPVHHMSPDEAQRALRAVLVDPSVLEQKSSNLKWAIDLFEHSSNAEILLEWAHRMASAPLVALWGKSECRVQAVMNAARHAETEEHVRAIAKLFGQIRSDRDLKDEAVEGAIKGFAERNSGIEVMHIVSEPVMRVLNYNIAMEERKLESFDARIASLKDDIRILEGRKAAQESLVRELRARRAELLD